MKNGSKGALENVELSSLNFSSIVKNDTTMRVAQYYTANESLNTIAFNISSVGVQYTAAATRTLNNTELPSSGNITFNFPAVTGGKKVYVLKASLKFSFVLPIMNIQTFSNSAVGNAYRLGSGTNAYTFLMDSRNFGQNASSVVKSKGFTITPPTSDNLGDATNAARKKFNNLLNDPANYPDILVFANYHDYASFEGHELMNQFLLAGGGIFYTHDDASLEDADKGGPGLALILDSPGALLQKHSENYSVYRFTDTPEGANDDLILKGPFQPNPSSPNLSSYYWGQDRIGTSYITNITSPDVIIYSNQPVNHASNTFTNHGSFLRHKTKNFFFAGDGGFFAGRPAYATSITREPFRINSSTTPNLVLASFGKGYGGFPDGNWQIANSFVFGNAIAYMINRIHYYGINRSGGVLVVPDPTGDDNPNDGPPENDPYD